MDGADYMGKIEPKRTETKGQLLKIIDTLNYEIETLENKVFFANSNTNQEKDKVFRLEKKNKKLSDELKNKDDEIQKLKDKIAGLKRDKPKEATKNERGAGRKSKITGQLVQEVKLLHECENTQKAIADILGLSSSTVNKIIRNYLN